jgi:hypothetical protein
MELALCFYEFSQLNRFMLLRSAPANPRNNYFCINETPLTTQTTKIIKVSTKESFKFQGSRVCLLSFTHWHDKKLQMKN